MAHKGRLGGKFAHAAHIKRHTKGTSNEISFSVLDAAKMTLDGDDEPLPHGGLLGRIPLFTLPGRRGKKVSATPTKEQELVLPTGEPLPKEPLPAPSPIMQKSNKNQGQKASVSRENEIARRKARRHRYRVAATAFVIICSVGLLGAAGTLLYSNHQEHVSYVDDLKNSLGVVEHVDESLVLMDDALKDPASQDSLETMEELLAVADSLRAQLDDAHRLATSALQGMRDSSADKETAANALTAIEARLEMLSQGEALMSAALGASKASEALTEAWGVVIEGDSLAREAAQLVSSYTVENIEASQGKTQEALDLFEEALRQVEGVAAAYPGIDVSVQQEYLQTRLEAQQHALASGEAMLNEDTAVATSENEACNKAETQAAQLAESLPSDPADPAVKAYAAVTDEPAKAYEEARSQAAAADAFLRDYLGSFSK